MFGESSAVGKLELLFTEACIACPRARVRRGQGGHYTDRYYEWRDRMQIALLETCNKQLGCLRPLWDGDVRLEVHCHGARANADVDNLLKSVMDSLQGIIVVNDKQVRQAEVSSWPVDGMGKQTFVIVELLAKGA